MLTHGIQLHLMNCLIPALDTDSVLIGSVMFVRAFLHDTLGLYIDDLVLRELSISLGRCTLTQ